MLPTNTSEENEFVKSIFTKVDAGDIGALYQKGALYELGDYVEQDKQKALAIFKEAADKGHAHSMWIHACKLLWDLNSYPQAINEGLYYLVRAIEYGSGEACITKAKLHCQQEFGFKQDKQEVNKLRKLAKQYDKTIFDPYA